MIQLAISEPRYLAQLESLLSRSGGWKLLRVDSPDPTQMSVMVVDERALARLPRPLLHPERFVYVTENCPERLHEAWESGIRSVVFYNDPVSTAVLAIMAASLRVPKTRLGAGSLLANSPRGTLACMSGNSKRVAETMYCMLECKAHQRCSAADECEGKPEF